MLKSALPGQLNLHIRSELTAAGQLDLHVGSGVMIAGHKEMRHRRRFMAMNMML